MPGRAERGLDLFLVAEGLEFAGSHQERPGQVGQVVRLEPVAEDLEIPRLEVAACISSISSKFGYTHHWPISWLITGTDRAARCSRGSR